MYIYISFHTSREREREGGLVSEYVWSSQSNHRNSSSRATQESRRCGRHVRWQVLRNAKEQDHDTNVQALTNRIGIREVLLLICARRRLRRRLLLLLLLPAVIVGLNMNNRCDRGSYRGLLKVFIYFPIIWRFSFRI